MTEKQLFKYFLYSKSLGNNELSTHKVIIKCIYDKCHKTSNDSTIIL